MTTRTAVTAKPRFRVLGHKTDSATLTKSRLPPSVIKHAFHATEVYLLPKPLDVKVISAVLAFFCSASVASSCSGGIRNELTAATVARRAEPGVWNCAVQLWVLSPKLRLLNAVANVAQGFKIGEVVGFDVRFEQAKRPNVVDNQAGFNVATICASVSIPSFRQDGLATPVWSAIVFAASPPRRAILTTHGFSVRDIKTSSRAKPSGGTRMSSVSNTACFTLLRDSPVLLDVFFSSLPLAVACG